MPSLRSLVMLVGAAFVVAFAASEPASAQSTLFNIPSTDVVGQKHAYLEFDFISHLESHEEGGFQAYAPRAVFGVAKGVEAGVNVVATDALAPDQPVEIQPNVKWQFYSGDNGVAATVGGILYTPIANRDGIDTFGLVYFNVSKKVTGKYGPRVTGGAYGLVGRDDDTGTEGGAIVGFEQPLHPRVTLLADWFSGKNRFGYVTPGLGFSLPKNSILYTGYSIGNQGRKNNALFIYYGITF